MRSQRESKVTKRTEGRKEKERGRLVSAIRGRREMRTIEKQTVAQGAKGKETE